MNAVDTTQAVQEVYAAFGRGDVPAILALLAEDADLHHEGPGRHPPLGDVLSGKGRLGAVLPGCRSGA